MEPQMDLKKDEEYKLRSMTSQEKEDNDTGDLIPNYKIKLNLSDDEQEDFTRQAFLEYDAIKKEREDLGLEEKWEERDRQYDGELKKNKTLAFNLHVHESKIKSDAIVRAINEAFLDSVPMMDVSPTPEMGRKDGFEIAEKQGQFLEYAVREEVKPETSLSKISKSAVNKFVGIGKLSWRYKREKRRREETYEGKRTPVGMTPDGQLVEVNEGIQKFLTVYPDGMETQKGIIKRLAEEKKVELVVEFKDTIHNNPKLDYIKIENFYVKNSTNYWEGLRDTHFVGEVQEYSYWELIKKEKEGEFEKVERLWINEDADAGETRDYTTVDYKVLEVTTYRKMKPEDDEEIKVKAWFGLGSKNDEKKIYLGSEIYPYYGFDTDYIPFYIKLNDDGFYGGVKSVLLDLRDINVAEDVLLNLSLHSTYVRNVIKPIIREGSEAEESFMEGSIESPIIVDDLTDDVNKAIGFVQWPNVDNQASLIWSEKLKRISSDVSRVSDLTTGGESELDPSAPASKTIALLQQSGIGVKDYIRAFLPSFNIFAGMLLQLYYQMSQEDKEYKVVGKSTAVTGDNPFSSITRDEMAAKTNIKSRAAAFAFDKMNEKKEAMAAYQLVMQDPYARQQPELLYKALKTLLETFGDRWEAIVDTTLASPEEFQQQMNQVAMQAIQALFQQAQQQGQTTGVAPNPREVISAAPGAVQQAQAEAYSPEMREEREKQEKAK